MTTKAAPRILGHVLVTFPMKGYFWIMGEDGVKYYGHVAKFRDEYSLFDIREGQKCTFVPNTSDPRGPAAMSIDMLESVG